VSLSQVLEDVDSDAVRWLVVETEGDDQLLAVARMHAQDNGSVLIDLMAVVEELQHKGLGSWLLRRIESMAAEMGVANIIVEIAQCRDDLAAWLTRRQYERMGGYVSEELGSGIDDRPVTFLQFQVPCDRSVVIVVARSRIHVHPWLCVWHGQRQVRTGKAENEDESGEATRSTLAAISTAFAEILHNGVEELASEAYQPAVGEAAPTPLENDIADLFAALHRTYG
jgi:N-acetylglutamate synthase-like GNAT family acetyltransferase